jgi:GntR family transcriptional regulator
MSPSSNPPADLPRLGGVSLAEQARSEILSAILDGRFETRLPPEDDLAKLLSVSRTTIRAALNSLEREGVITRRRAIGTTVNRHALQSALFLQNLVGFDRLLRDEGHSVDIEVSSWVGVPKPWLLERFDLSPDAEYFLTQKAYMADGRMALHARDIVFMDTIESLPADEPPPASLFDFSAQYCKTPIDHAIAQVGVAVVGRDETKLTLGESEPFLRIFESHYSEDAELLAHSVIDVDDSFIRFEVFRRGKG